MKKTYIYPRTILTVINCERLISTSFGKNESGADADVVLVKGDNRGSRSDVNVWEDDWSRN